MLHWLSVSIGLNNASGPQYLFWSGFAGDIPLFGGAYALLRKHNCEVHRCPRIGKHTTNSGHLVCRRHHPDEPLTHKDLLARNNKLI